jgi:4-hydroxy-3-polyprenylbenzoate decarboxylase
MSHPVVLAITGASGAVYARRLYDLLLMTGRDLHLMISPSGAAVFKQELDLVLDLNQFQPAQLCSAPVEFDSEHRTPWGGRVFYHHHDDFMAPVASGSFLTSGMVICPCSGGTMSGIAHGASNNLIQRAADVHLKEHRKLVVVPRETPLSSIQLENMKRVADAGGVVLPAMPGWYHGVSSLQDLIDFVVVRILDQLGIQSNLMRRWGETESPTAKPHSQAPHWK